MARSITGEYGAVHTLRVIKSDWTAVIMRNGGCVPGHSISVAFHQSRGRGGPAARLCFSICASSRTNNWQAAYRRAHTITFTHTPSCRHVGEWTCTCTNTHGPTTDHMYIHMAKGLHTNTHTHTHTSMWHKRNNIRKKQHILHVSIWWHS